MWFSTSHGYLSMAVFILIYWSHSYRWAAVVPQSNWQSWALSCKTHMYIMLLPMCTWKKKKKKKNFLPKVLVKVQDCCMFKFKEILGYISSYHPIPAQTGFYFIGRIRFLTWVAFFFSFFLLLGECAIRLLSFRKVLFLFALYTKAIDQGRYTSIFFFFFLLLNMST